MLGAVLLFAAGCDGDERIVSPESNPSDVVTLEGSPAGSPLMSVMPVDPGSISTTVSDDFSDLAIGFHDGIVSRTGVAYAESFAGISVVPVLTWDYALAHAAPPPDATSPLSLTVGAQHENLFGAQIGPPVNSITLAGCGPLTPTSPPAMNCERAAQDAYGTGAVSALFDGDTDVVVLTVLAALGIADTADTHGAWVSFFGRDGTFLGRAQLGSSPGCTDSCAEAAFRSASLDGVIRNTVYGRSQWAFSAPAGQRIAGILFENQAGAWFVTDLSDGEFGIKLEEIAWNRLPVAVCQNVTVDVDAGNPYAAVPVASIDDGSAAASGGSVTLSLRRATGETYPLGTEPINFGIFPIGTTPTLLVVQNELGNEATCEADVTVNAPPPPTPVDPHLLCNVPAERTITPPDAPITFTATGTDGSGAIPVTVTGYECYGYNGAGKRVNKGESCIVSTDGASVTVLDAGGVGDFIAWTIEPAAGGTPVSCTIGVINPNG